MIASNGRRCKARCGLALAVVAATGWASSGTMAAGPTEPLDGGALTIDSMADGQLVLRLGLVGSYWQGDSPDDVSVYTDGLVVVRDDGQQLGYASDVIDRAALNGLLSVAAQATPFDEVDYGEVLITDVGSTRVEVHADQGDAVIEVWALHHVDGLTAEQRASRERLLALVAELEALADDATEPYTSEHVMLTLRPVLPGMDPQGTPTPWSIADQPTSLFSDAGFHSVCMDVPAANVAGLPREADGELLWSLPDGLGVATPAAVAASVTAMLPEQKPCEAFDPVGPSEALAPDELLMPPHDWTSPWPQGIRMTSLPFEEWSAVDAMARTVLPAELGGDWDWNRWSWFDYRFAAADVAGRRVLDFRATCTEYVTDEEPACTIDARFDAVTGELLEFAAT